MSSNVTTTPSIDPFIYYLTIVQCANCSTGLLLNGFLIYIIFRNKELRSSCCSLFILLLASFDWINEFSIATLPTILTVSGSPISLFLCFFLGSYGNYIFYNMNIMMLTISLDRLASMIAPIKYKLLSRRHKWKYVLFVVLLPAGGLLPFFFQYYKYCSSQGNLQVYCQASDVMGPDGKNYGFMVNVWAKAGTFLVYFCIFLLIKCKVVKIWQDDKLDRRLSKSLSVLMAITLFLALPGPLFVQYILPALKIADQLTNESLYHGVLQLSKVSQALNGPVLYFCSVDYRSAIQKEWAKWFGCNVNVNTETTPQQQQQNVKFGMPSTRRTVAVAPKPMINPSPTPSRGNRIVPIPS